MDEIPIVRITKERTTNGVALHQEDNNLIFIVTEGGVSAKFALSKKNAEYLVAGIQLGMKPKGGDL